MVLVLGDMDISVLANYISERQKVHPALEDRISFYQSSGGGAPGGRAPGPRTPQLVALLGLVWGLYGGL